jgi:hypothetical protein
MNNDNLKNALNDIGKDVVADIVQQLIAADKKATGDLINSINFEVLEVAGGVLLNILSNDYFDFVDKGRSPGKMPPVSSIRPWVEAKGIKMTTSSGILMSSNQSAFVIARSIGEKGIKPLNIKDKVIQDILNNKEQYIELGVSLDITQYINEHIFKS